MVDWSADRDCVDLSRLVSCLGPNEWSFIGRFGDARRGIAGLRTRPHRLVTDGAGDDAPGGNASPAIHGVEQLAVSPPARDVNLPFGVCGNLDRFWYRGAAVS